MAAAISLLCAITAVFCAWLILRSYRQSRHRLLFWSAICFAGLFLNNLMLLAGQLLLESDLMTWQLLVALGALLPMLYGLIREEN